MVFATLAVSVLSLIVAGLAWRKSSQAADANVRVADIEQQRRADEVEARLHADIRLGRKTVGMSEYVTIQNVGQHVATNVELVALDARQMTSVLSAADPTIRPGETQSVLISINFGAEMPPRFGLTWTDADGTHHDERTVSLAP